MRKGLLFGRFTSAQSVSILEFSKPVRRLILITQLKEVASHDKYYAPSLKSWGASWFRLVRMYVCVCVRACVPKYMLSPGYHTYKIQFESIFCIHGGKTRSYEESTRGCFNYIIYTTSTSSCFTLPGVM